MSASDQQILSTFGQGRACARRGGYLSDNPCPYESELWAVWRLGFVDATPAPPQPLAGEE